MRPFLCSHPLHRQPPRRHHDYTSDINPNGFALSREWTAQIRVDEAHPVDVLAHLGGSDPWGRADDHDPGATQEGRAGGRVAGTGVVVCCGRAERRGGGRHLVDPNSQSSHYPDQRSERPVSADPSRVDEEARERGAASTLSMVLLAPMFVVISLLAFQAAMWSHARTEARVRVRDVAGIIARSGLSASAAQALVRDREQSGSLLNEVDIEIEDLSQTVRVTLRAQAPGILRGTSAPVEVSTTLWRERWQP